MPNDASAEKAGSAKHGDGATVRCHHDSNSPVYVGSFSLLVVEGPIRAIEQPINLARHDEVVLMQSFDLLGAQRDSSIAPAEADVRVMAFWLGKLTNFHEEAHSMDDACTNWAEEFFSRMRSAEIGIHHHIARFSDCLPPNQPLERCQWHVGYR